MNEDQTVGSFEYFRLLNHRIYQNPNRIVYSNTLELVAKIVFYAARLREKGIHKGRPEEIKRCTVMAFSWLMAFANRVGMTDIGIQAYRHFDKCPYCTGLPCSCGSGKKTGRILFEYQGQSLLVDEFQTHISKVYPSNTLERSGNHLVAEAAELMEAYMTYRRNEGVTTLAHVIEEFCDVTGHLVSIAHCDGFSLSHETRVVFQNGCPGCGLPECGCDYVEIVGSKVHV